MHERFHGNDGDFDFGETDKRDREDTLDREAFRSLDRLTSHRPDREQCRGAFFLLLDDYRSVMRNDDADAQARRVYQQLGEDYPQRLLGWVLSGHWSLREIPLDEIDTKDRDHWTASHDGKLESFREKLRDGIRKPAVLVKVPGQPKYKIVDGHHRFLAHEAEGLPLLAYVAEMHVSRGPWDTLHDAQKKGRSGPSYQGPSWQGANQPGGDSVAVGDRRQDDGGDFDPDKHPRASNGQFGEGGETEKTQQPGSRSGPLFKPEHLEGLKLEASQKHGDKEKLFAEAREAHEAQVDLLDRGAGLDKDLGTTAIRADTMSHTDVEKAIAEKVKQPGPVVVIGPMKTAASADRKIRDEYAGDASQVTDIVRASVAVDSMDQVHEVVEKLRERGVKLAKVPADRFAKPLASGYRDLNMKLEYPNGHVGELQVHLKPILEAKATGHKAYELTRELAPKLQSRSMTKADWKKYDTAMRSQQKLYDAAWKKGNGEG
jgi:tRNA isopentenyl-2-thiomethyl-A-37 hydroxylase MiaE